MNIRRTGRRVQHGVEVDGDASVALKAGKRYVVVAHGIEKGTTVLWFRDDWKKARRWLFVGMKTPPKDTRVYLYCCYAGKKLPHFLKGCEVFGHTDTVPTPIGPSRDIVLAFFGEVEKLLKTDFDHDTWRAALGDYVNRLYAAEVQNPTSIWGAPVLAILRKSLGFPGP